MSKSKYAFIAVDEDGDLFGTNDKQRAMDATETHVVFNLETGKELVAPFMLHTACEIKELPEVEDEDSEEDEGDDE